MKQTPLIVILFDSITNSVFQSQVILPLLTHHAWQRPIYIVSFETQHIPTEELMQLTACHPFLHFIIRRRMPFVGVLSIYQSAWALRSILRTFDYYELRARGPLAGLVAYHASTIHCLHLTIQARGLLAEEYDYTTLEKPFSWLHSARSILYSQIESCVYGAVAATTDVPITIEAVSPALKKYLQETYATPEHVCRIATEDIPPMHDQTTLTSLRIMARNQLEIEQDAYVVCYNGSSHAWQCPEKVIEHFKQRKALFDRCILLILTTNPDHFVQLLTQETIDAQFYRVKSVPHNEVFQYLAAADEGVVFRQPHIINWVSRPTKVLEYQAVGLPIVHNNTIAMLSEC